MKAAILALALLPLVACQPVVVVEKAAVEVEVKRLPRSNPNHYCTISPGENALCVVKVENPDKTFSYYIGPQDVVTPQHKEITKEEFLLTSDEIVSSNISKYVARRNVRQNELSY